MKKKNKHFLFFISLGLLPNRKRHKCWRPGAISKRLLRQLNKAKKQTAQPQENQSKKAKKVKKHEVEEKPTLIISKKDGEYKVEMQVSSKIKDALEKPSPLIYKIASADNDAKVAKRELKQHRLIKKTIKEVWKDPYHPEVCETRCLKAYQQAVGILPCDTNNTECICPEEVRDLETVDSCSCDDLDLLDVSSDSSTDVEWEIHFTPPKKCSKSPK